MKFTTGQHDRPTNRHWLVQGDGRNFVVRAERKYRNSNPGRGEGSTSWVLFVWLVEGDKHRIVVEPFECSAAPRTEARKVITNWVERNAAA